LEAWLQELAGGKQGGRETLNVTSQPNTAKSAESNVRDVLADLITLLSRRDVINDSEGKALLRKLAK
jgi:hypothetical protein